MMPRPVKLNKIFFQETGKPKYGKIATQIPKNKSIRALRISQYTASGD